MLLTSKISDSVTSIVSKIKLKASRSGMCCGLMMEWRWIGCIRCVPTRESIISQACILWQGRITSPAISIKCRKSFLKSINYFLRRGSCQLSMATSENNSNPILKVNLAAKHSSANQKHRVKAKASFWQDTWKISRPQSTTLFRGTCISLA